MRHEFVIITNHKLSAVNNTKTSMKFCEVHVVTEWHQIISDNIFHTCRYQQYSNTLKLNFIHLFLTDIININEKQGFFQISFIEFRTWLCPQIRF